MLGLALGVLGLGMASAAFSGNTGSTLSLASTSLNGYAPTSASATRTSGTACQVTWTPAAGVPAGVTYEVTDGAGGVLATGLTGTTTSVTVGSGAVTPTVRVRKNLWVSSTQTSAPTCAAAGPDAPTAVTATLGDGQLTVAWTPGADNGSPITSYTATASPGGASCTTAATSCVIPGLVNGTVYAVTVTATNTNGTSVASTTVLGAAGVAAALYGSGVNGNGELGDGTTTQRTSFTQAGAVTTWTQASAGSNFSCMVRANSTLWCVGLNGLGQLGNGGTANTTTITQVGTGTTWLAVSAGSGHACAVRTDTTLWCWGYNNSGQVGDATSGTNRLNPTQVSVPAATGWRQVSAGLNHTCAVRTDATLYCWGANGSGQLGLGDTTTRTSPTQVTVPATTGWDQAGAGDSHTCAHRTDNTIYCWGWNSVGQVGDASTTQRLSPVVVTGGISTWASVWAAPYLQTCATRSDGTAWCWGVNADGELGDASTTNRTTGPVQVAGGATTWTQLSTGATHTCALRTNRSAWCWGRNSNGQLGDGTTTTPRSSPTQVATLIRARLAQPAAQ